VTKSGDTDEKLVQTWLEMQGFLVHRAAATGRIKIGGRWIQRSHDLYGCIDLLAIQPAGVWACQVTTLSNRSARRKKIEKVERHWPNDWRISVVVHGWDRLGRGTEHFLHVEDYGDETIGTARVWQPRKRVEIDPDSIAVWRKAQSPVSL
jgi:hypothetical protein